MYDHLLVPLDGSVAAEQVLPHAEALASAFGSTITLLTATVSAETIIAESVGAGSGVSGEVLSTTLDPMPIVEADKATMREYLAGVQARLHARNVEVQIDEPQGHAAQMIVERARDLDVSLILMTTHGRSGLQRMVFGSVADSVLRHAACPVLLVRVPASQG